MEKRPLLVVLATVALIVAVSTFLQGNEKRDPAGGPVIPSVAGTAVSTTSAAPVVVTTAGAF